MADKIAAPKPKLSPRLQMVADMTPPCARVLDIGTDHAFVPIYLVLSGRCSQAVASDIHRGPAAAAARNIAAYHMEEHISVRVADGLDGLAPDSKDCVVIAGMGGYEIRSILEKEPVRAKALILQPQKSFRELRSFLSESGYAIVREAIAREQDRYYVGIAAVYSGAPYELTLMEREIGPVLLREKPQHFKEYLGSRIRKIRRQLPGDPSVGALLEDLQEELRLQALAEKPAERADALPQ